MGFIRKDLMREQNIDYHDIYMNVHDRFEGDYKGLRDELTNSTRNRDITKYYQDRYVAYYFFVLMAVVLFIVYLLLSLLEVKKILPSGLIRPIILLVASLSICYLIYLRLDISRRQNIDFNKYKNKRPDVSTTGTGSANVNMGSCVGQECCTYGTKFDYENNLCREER